VTLLDVETLTAERRRFFVEMHGGVYFRLRARFSWAGLVFGWRNGRVCDGLIRSLSWRHRSESFCLKSWFHIWREVRRLEKDVTLR